MFKRRRRSPKATINRARRLFLFILLLLGSGGGFFLNGKVVTVHDGDTVSVLAGTDGLKRIRLYGIDCPETNQPGGLEATEYVTAKALFKNVELVPINKDPYGREVAILRMEDGTMLNEDIVAAGHAWVYPQYCDLPQCAVWKKKEYQARRQRLGLWKKPNPRPPWKWRKR